jgi:ATP-dependent DNA helicase RecG
MNLPPETPLESLDWVARPRLAALRRLGIATLADLVRHFPRRHEDRTKFDRFPDCESDRAICLCGIVRKTVARRFGPRRIFEARVEDESAGVLGSPLVCRWFNSPWISRMIVGDDRIVLFGKPRMRGSQVVMEHPEFEIIGDGDGRSIHFDRITPVHPAGDGISPTVLRELVHRALAETDLSALPLLWPDCGPDRGADRGPGPRVWSDVHFPESPAALEAARQCLVREEFFAIQLVVRSRRAAIRQAGGIARPGTGALWGMVEKSLGFALTRSQRDVMDEIACDLAAPRRMNRLLQGDVGSGKTLVALRAMLQAAESGWQAAIMAPTQILAEQHYRNFRRLLDPLKIPVALRTSALRESSSGPPDAAPLVVGTHALLHEGAEFQNLGLVVIDEQHKFGVLQRTRFAARADAPDVLVMTATPIPRTIAQTLYGDLDVSVIRHRPPGRGEVVTAVRDPAKLPDIIAFLRKKIAGGRQAYVVYPLVDESEKLEIKSARAEFERWRGILAPAEVGLVHGRLPADEKAEVMARFRDGRIAVLVATTVIEVGVDVPNACIMLVEEAGRFGLSQIHQLRGRIGRGSQKSYCILLQESPESHEKLSVLEATSDGFEIAEADLRIRGPGDILGTEQSGLPPLALGDLVRDAELMSEARRRADELLESDPALARPEHAPHRALVRASSRLEADG